MQDFRLAAVITPAETRLEVIEPSVAAVCSLVLAKSPVSVPATLVESSLVPASAVRTHVPALAEQSYVPGIGVWIGHSSTVTSSNTEFGMPSSAALIAAACAVLVAAVVMLYAMALMGDVFQVSPYSSLYARRKVPVGVRAPDPVGPLVPSPWVRSVSHCTSLYWSAESVSSPYVQVRWAQSMPK